MARQIAARDEVVPLLGEIFREHGYAGTSLSEITNQTGLGKSSLYHFFPGGKSEMAEAVLSEIDAWFTKNVFLMLREDNDPLQGIDAMFDEVDRYFNSGRRICLVGAFALDNTRDLFFQEVSNYFAEWIKALTLALKRYSLSASEAKMLAEEVVVGIQGALVLARSQNNARYFTRTIERLRERVNETLAEV